MGGNLGGNTVIVWRWTFRPDAMSSRTRLTWTFLDSGRLQNTGEGSAGPHLDSSSVIKTFPP